MAIQSITLVGTGNLAWHLGKMFLGAGVPVQHIAGRTPEKAEMLSNELNCGSYSEISSDLPASELYIICVKDDAIKDVAQRIYKEGRLIIHTSGTTGSDVLNMNGNRYGVIWPMHTFIKGNEMNYKSVLFSVTASDALTTDELGTLVKKISDRVEFVTDDQRAVLHMSAVWVNNFTNHMFDIASTLLKESGLTFDLMLPMIREMMEKAGTADPELLQTGPAKRGDMTTMEKHKHLLSNHPEWQQLYYEISRSIINKFIKQ